jgi:wobble nucleotide-excising tRNase
MIHKIATLTAIGKYISYTASGNVAFNKLTLIYSDNGTGKTTLTSVLRSANLNEPGLLQKRKSLNATASQAAQVISRLPSGDTHHTFHHTNGWSNPILGLEIFDSHFVNENVYSGFEFNDDHKKQLHHFVIGAQGVSLKRQIEQNKVDKAIKRDTIANTERQIIHLVGNDLTDAMLTQFLRLQPAAANGIDALIAEAEAALTNARSQSVINNFSLLQPITILDFPFDFIQSKSDVLATPENLQTEALKVLFSDHCSEVETNGLATPEGWLKAGFSYLANKKAADPEGTQPLKCPFCTEDINPTSNIILAYAGKFNEAFQQLVDRISAQIASLNSINIELEIEKVNQKLLTNTTAVASWTPYITSATAPSQVIIPNVEDLRTMLQTCKQLLVEKARTPTNAGDDQSLISLEAEIALIASNINTYNQQIATYNQAIRTFKAGIPPATAAQARVSELKRIKKRFEPAVSQLCSNATSEKQALQILDTGYATLIQQEATAAAAFFSHYQIRINHYLTDIFRTGFSIDNVSHVAPQGRATSSKLAYALKLHGHPLSFDAGQTNSVKEALSEGDKSTIALAFFLAKLDVDANIADKIIVFDDPLSSFDSNRKGYTIELLCGLLPRVKQVIVLSHNEFFLHGIDKRVAAGSKQCLRIFENYTTRESSIEQFDLNVLVENKFFKHIRELKGFVSNPDLAKKDIVLGWIRNVLEAYIGFRFVSQVSHLPHSQHTLGTFVQELINQNVPFRNNANRQSIITKLNMLNGISMSLHHGSSTPGGITPIDTSTMTVTELVNYISDTLQLIEQEL